MASDLRNTIDTMHSACQVGGSLLDGFSFACPVSSGFIERDPVRNVPDVVVELPITPVPIVGLWFLNLGEDVRD